MESIGALREHLGGFFREDVSFSLGGLKLALQEVTRTHTYRFTSEIDYGEQHVTGFEVWGYSFSNFLTQNQGCTLSTSGYRASQEFSLRLSVLRICREQFSNPHMA